ncbi:MAG: single-stranded-DNA-specific exonuclease RecJ [Clostridiaceae bacterium]
MEKWTVRNVKCELNNFKRNLNINDTVAKLLVNRGIYKVCDAQKFLNPKIDYLYKPDTMKDLCKSSKLLKENIDSGKKILIVGDYDVDGVISTYILYKCLRKLNANVSYHIPDRIKEGYGINESIIRNAKDEKIDLIITCDNGISAIEQIRLAKELGISVIVTDHHDVPFKEDNDGNRKFIIPSADCVVNPKQLDCSYPFKNLCGAGVVYKLIENLFDLYKINKSEVTDLLQYVAIATVCDVVDLVDENRIIVKQGLEQINNTNNIGLNALFEETGVQDKKISVYTLGFIVGPSINASGRLEQAFWALELLLSSDVNKAKKLAEKLNGLNKERQVLTKEGVDKANSIIQDNSMQEDKVLIVYLDDIHESIAGIIAGRIREKYNLPTIILTRANDGAKGSGRSIEEYNMFEELLKCKDLLGKFGGHPMAAGMSIPIENIDAFRERLNQVHSLTDEDVQVKVKIDLSLPFNKINYNLIDEISLLEPYGKGNPKPTFGVKKIKVIEAKILGKNKNVLKLKLSDGNLVVDGIYFGDIEKFQENIKNKYGESEFSRLFNTGSNKVFLDLIYFPEINEYRGNKKVQLVISNYRVS